MPEQTEVIQQKESLEQTYIDLVKQKAEYQGGYEVLGDQHEMIAVHDHREQVHYVDYLVTPSGLYATIPHGGVYGNLVLANLVKDKGSMAFEEQSDKIKGKDGYLFQEPGGKKYALVDRLDLNVEDTRIIMRGVLTAAAEKARKEAAPAPVKLALEDI